MFWNGSTAMDGDRASDGFDHAWDRAVSVF
jgi:hypothetical protein